MCCGDSSDYDQPQPQNLQGFLLPPGPHQQRRVDHYEQKRVQVQATEAAQRAGNRDSYLEPALGGALYGLPGSDFHQMPAPAAAATRPPQNYAVQRRKPVAADPRQQQQQQRPNTPYHSRPQQQQQQQQQQPGGSGSFGAAPTPPKPSYHGAERRQPVPQPQLARYRAHPQRPSPPPVVRERPMRMPPMSSAPAIRRDIVINGVDPRVHRAEPQAAAFGYADFEPLKLVRRDSNGVSECSSDDDRDDPDAWRRHNVSPEIASSREKISHNLYDHMGLGYGRAGCAF
ncbi:hypothetical protein DL766_009081 [Monosporascus sp. MC13-8B]|uniref:Uncharacterized protein n=1 Tax=Monosporascus cannonballus TaxID=155416 RepID=A0ABY0H7M3_9PEZI|nr:hypothetical protein DL763_009101 [Monosporascus cannonballus]RYO86990.1 hypothetical protein DL762_004415 [Monosporascus cannonballus]RYP16652.1 hypothetical protein DL766_009081 [Monosporascus sp. MC13-8B]